MKVDTSEGGKTIGRIEEPIPLIVIVGETASGKSALALALAEKLNGEIICADSWTVYPGFDIGTAKPTAEDRRRVPHHLLDIADPHKGFSVVEFQRQALVMIEAIAQRGKLPIMVGGSGLYIDSVLFNYTFLPPPSPKMRETLNTLSLEELKSLAVTAGLDTTGIDVRNKRRIIRLIENNGVRPGKHGLRERTLILGLRNERDSLRKRITERIDRMLMRGLEGEAQELSQHYGWETEPMKGIGYREWEAYFAGTQTLGLTRERIISATLNLAKRQRTWFKRNDSIHWLTDRDEQTDIVDIITTFLSK